MRALHPILTAAGLSEDIKWAKPCYTHDGRNIAIMQEMKDFLALMFFKGALLDDPDGLLRSQGPNSRSARRLEFTSTEAVESAAPAIRALVAQAIAVEEAGLDAGPAPEEELAPELQERLDSDAALAAAFGALTPGRRREYNLHISGAKRPETRASRLDRCVPIIMAGKGMRDR
jgi:uncharacterized protein YdeI (YjbR/CyaY-like superfamily)